MDTRFTIGSGSPLRSYPDTRPEPRAAKIKDLDIGSAEAQTFPNVPLFDNNADGKLDAQDVKDVRDIAATFHVDHLV